MGDPLAARYFRPALDIADVVTSPTKTPGGVAESSAPEPTTASMMCSADSSITGAIKGPSQSSLCNIAKRLFSRRWRCEARR